MEPIFIQVWPKERRFNQPKISYELANLCVRSGAAFPVALQCLRHHLVSMSREWQGLHFLSSSSAPSDYPRATLDLLWILRGPSSQGSSGDLGQILDVVAKAEPSLVIDRRFQWLEGKAVRY